MQALAVAGLSATMAQPVLPLLVLNATYPLVPDELADFCRGKRAVLVLEEGHPEFIEFELAALLERAGVRCAIDGKAMMDCAGEYQAEAVVAGVDRFVARHAPGLARPRGRRLARRGRCRAPSRRRAARRAGAAAAARILHRLPGAPGIRGAEAGRVRARPAALRGRHRLPFVRHVPPFQFGHSITGYGMGLASAAAVASLQQQRTLATVGDGGFWHNAFLSGVTTAVKNGTDAVLLIFKNGYTSATGTQDIVSTPAGRASRRRRRREHDGHGRDHRERARGRRRALAPHRAHLRRRGDEGDADRGVHDTRAGPQGDRRGRRMPARAAAPPEAAAGAARAAGQRVERVRYGIDDAICTGDRSCVRLSGCPSLTLKSSADPLRTAPVTTIDAAASAAGCAERWRRSQRCARRSIASRSSATRPLGAVPRAAARRPGPALRRRSRDRRDGRASRGSGSRRRDRAARGDRVAALGGQGGGVLVEWIGHAARPGAGVQATSTPGVSQRTGATTYYVELRRAATPVARAYARASRRCPAASTSWSARSCSRLRACSSAACARRRGRR